MAQTPEGKVKEWLKRNMERSFPSCWKYMPPGGRYGKAGTPDLLYCINGVFVAIEVKADKGKLTKLQEIELLKLERAGAITAVMYGKDDNILVHLINTVKGKIHRLERD